MGSTLTHAAVGPSNAAAFDARTREGDQRAREGRHAEALDAYRAALALGPATEPLLLALSTSSFECNRLDEAAAYARVAGDLAPESPRPRVQLGVIELLRGNAPAGWAGLAHRKRLVPSPVRAAPPVPPWDGGPLEGVDLLLLREQGFGDVLQFVRYGTRLMAQGATVYLDVQPALRRLLAGQGLGEVLSDGSSARISRYVHLMDLPGLLGVPPQGDGLARPYLRVDAPCDLVPGPRPLQVGLAWAGNPAHPRDRQRSLPLPSVQALLQRGDCEFHSLLVGGAAARAAAQLDPAGRFGARVAAVADFLDLARLVASLDLVITVDTAVAHLAGAMGRPAWVLLGAAPDWRWGVAGDTTAWYGAMRLFRQPAPGDWLTPLAAVGRELDRRAAAGG